MDGNNKALLYVWKFSTYLFLIYNGFSIKNLRIWQTLLRLVNPDWFFFRSVSDFSVGFGTGKIFASIFNVNFTFVSPSCMCVYTGCICILWREISCQGIFLKKKFIFFKKFRIFLELSNFIRLWWVPVVLFQIFGSWATWIRNDFFPDPAKSLVESGSGFTSLLAKTEKLTWKCSCFFVAGNYR
jgi:hypothetical protein